MQVNNKPNIVYIVLDQWRGDCLGIADSQHPVMTPHIDQIAWEGIWYQRAYADCPLTVSMMISRSLNQSLAIGSIAKTSRPA